MRRSFRKVDFIGQFSDTNPLGALPQSIENQGDSFNRLDKIIGFRRWSDCHCLIFRNTK